jgi:hypothetical protein
VRPKVGLSVCALFVEWQFWHVASQHEGKLAERFLRIELIDKKNVKRWKSKYIKDDAQ